jgi:hypothetical protein
MIRRAKGVEKKNTTGIFINTMYFSLFSFGVFVTVFLLYTVVFLLDLHTRFIF